MKRNFKVEHNLNKTIVLVGMMGSGKTVIGRGLAKRLKAKFIDLDQEIVKAANLEITEIFATFGEEFFREKESKILERLIFGPQIVLASGGGAFISKKNQHLILANTFSIWLKSDPKILWSRLKNKKNRPLLNECGNLAEFKKIYKLREKSYSRADLCVSNEHVLSIDKMIEKTFTYYSNFVDVNGKGKDYNA
jgi:shikimate kinase